MNNIDSMIEEYVAKKTPLSEDDRIEQLKIIYSAAKQDMITCITAEIKKIDQHIESDDIVDESELCANICKWTKSTYQEYMALSVWVLIGQD